MIREVGSDWWRHQGGRPRGEGGRPAPGPDRLPVHSHGFWSLLDGRKLHGALISLCVGAKADLETQRANTRLKR